MAIYIGLADPETGGKLTLLTSGLAYDDISGSGPNGGEYPGGHCVQRAEDL